MKSKKKANLIRHTHLFSKDEFICSACGYRADKRYNPCPRCGAVIKGIRSDMKWFDEMEEYDMIFED